MTPGDKMTNKKDLETYFNSISFQIPILSITLNTHTKMWGVHLPSSHPFVYALFGIQLPITSPSTSQIDLVSELTHLLSNKPAHIDHLLQDSPSPNPFTPEEGQGTGKTRIWLTYWSSPEAYKTWWTSPAVEAFWTSLPPDAGVWREVMTIPASRAQHGTNKTIRAGLGHLGKRVSVAEKSGYWGCYRERMSAWEDEGDRMESEWGLRDDGASFSSSCSGYYSYTRADEQHTDVDIKPDSNANSNPESDKDSHHPGRILVTNIPSNICFVVEGQDHSAITSSEQDLWFKRFDPLVTQWIKDLVSSTTPPTSSGPGTGTGTHVPELFRARLCYDPSSGLFRSDPDVPALNYNKKVQLFYFRDLGCLERIGRLNKGHVRLRRDFLDAYGPGGEMGKVGGLRLWVETSVVKNGEMECEYVGCVPGTGLMGFAQKG